MQFFHDSHHLVSRHDIYDLIIAQNKHALLFITLEASAVAIILSLSVMITHKSKQS